MHAPPPQVSHVVELQAVLQQTPPTHAPLRHWLAVEQAPPFSTHG